MVWVPCPQNVTKYLFLMTGEVLCPRGCVSSMARLFKKCNQMDYALNMQIMLKLVLRTELMFTAGH